MDEVARLARERRPKLIIAGWSAYPRQLDFAAFRAHRRRGRRVAHGRHGPLRRARRRGPAPLPRAARARRHLDDRTRPSAARAAGSSCARPRDLAKKLNSTVFPGQQGGPLEHVIAAKAVAFKLAGEPEFRERQERTLDGARILADRLLAEPGLGVVSGGTDVHLVLVDLRTSTLDGKQAEQRLDRVGITVNRNAVPFDPRPPMISSGVRIGTAALATRGFGDRRTSARSPRSSPSPCAPRSPRSSSTPWATASPRWPTATPCTRS